MSETLLMREIHNLQEVINDCLDDIPVADPKVEELKDKYYQSLGMLQKSLHTDFYMGKVLAYKECLRLHEVKV